MRLLVLGVLLLGSAASAQDLSGFAQQVERCRDTGGAAACRAALDQSHRLKNWAEASKLWRCYTAVLGAEAEMIAASSTSRQPQTATEAWQEMRSTCAR